MRRNPLFLTVLLALALVWAGCSSGPPSLSISAKNGRNGLALDAANTVELTAVIKGVEVNPDEIVWSVSDPLLAEITGSGRSVTVTGLKAGEVVVSAVYGDLEDAYKLYIFDTKPVKEVFREDFEGFDAGTPSAKAGYSFSGNTVIAAGEGGQGEKALKLTKTGENAQLRVEFGQALTKGSVS
ncbi:MAG: Ig-like domain-containing protein, partial [Limnochordia bacterium]